MIEEPVWLGLDTVLQGVADTLQEMRARRLKLSLLTARTRSEWVPQQLDRLGLSKLFDDVTVVSADGSALAKASRLRLLCISSFFGDTESDMRAAAIAGVPYFAVATGQRDKLFLARAGAKRVYDNLSEAWRSFLRRSDSPVV
jgi:phosphoglycolate phosphatase-like HAD superfamily hydrolase